MAVKCYLLEPTDRTRTYLRRFCHCDAQHYHDTWIPVGDIPSAGQIIRMGKGDFAHDPRWPTRCDCGYAFKESDEWQVFYDSIYRRSDTGAEMTLKEATPGAMWDAEWMHMSGWTGPDGKSLICVCPGGSLWHIDSRASNCTKPDDDVHKCWVRHGTPPNLTVDKNGETCAAGAGSIQTPNWHGFLRDGELTE